MLDKACQQSAGVRGHWTLWAACLVTLSTTLWLVRLYFATQDLAHVQRRYERTELARHYRGSEFVRLSMHVADDQLAGKRYVPDDIDHLLGKPDAVSPWGTQMRWLYYYDNHGHRDGIVLFVFGQGQGLQEVGFGASSGIVASEWNSPLGATTRPAP